MGCSGSGRTSRGARALGPWLGAGVGAGRPPSHLTLLSCLGLLPLVHRELHNLRPSGWRQTGTQHAQEALLLTPSQSLSPWGPLGETLARPGGAPQQPLPSRTRAVATPGSCLSRAPGVGAATRVGPNPSAGAQAKRRGCHTRRTTCFLLSRHVQARLLPASDSREAGAWRCLSEPEGSPSPRNGCHCRRVCAHALVYMCARGPSGACVLGPLVGEGRTPPEHTSRVRGPHVWRAQAREPQGHREEAGWLSLTSHHAFCRWELRAKHWLWNPVWVHISVLPLVSSVTFSKTLFLSEPQFPI